MIQNVLSLASWHILPSSDLHVGEEIVWAMETTGAILDIVFVTEEKAFEQEKQN